MIYQAVYLVASRDPKAPENVAAPELPTLRSGILQPLAALILDHAALHTPTAYDTAGLSVVTDRIMNSAKVTPAGDEAKHDPSSAELASEFSAQRLLTLSQRAIGLIVLSIFAVGMLIDWTTTAATIVTMVTLYFLISTIDRTYLVCRGLLGGARVHVTEEQAFSIPDSDLPIYTVLLPAYDEPDIVVTLLEGVSRIDYPADKLDVLLVLEEDDEATISALRRPKIHNIKIVIVPPSLPRRNPKRAITRCHSRTNAANM